MSDLENLSIKLFKSPKHAKETSCIVNSVENAMGTFHNALDGDSNVHWYRVLRRPQWAWQGLDPIDIEEVLARIAASKNTRTHDCLLDTVVGYRSGNWSYEWVQCAMAHQLKAAAMEKEGGTDIAKEWLRASTCFSIAGYPYLKGDALSSQAQTLANKAFHTAIEKSTFKVKSIVTKVDGKPLEGFLYLPHTNAPLATVIVSAGFDSLQTDLWPLFETYFAPANIAMLTLDMPSLGKSQHWNLNEDTSRLHQAMLNELPNVPWVDHHRVGCMGVRMGANAAVRLAFLEQNKVKSCVSIGGILHGLLSDANGLKEIPAMYLDTLASRMGKNSAMSTLLVLLQVLSLKNQGILSGRKTQVPILALRLENDPLCSDLDDQLAAFYSLGGEAKKMRSKPLHDAYHRIMLETIEWFNRTL